MERKKAEGGTRMNGEVMGAIAEAIATFTTYALFIAICDRVVGIIVKAFAGKERFI